MYKLSERCRRLRTETVDEKVLNDFITPQRDFYYYRGICEVPENRRTNDYLSAAGVASVIRNIPALIGGRELIVGRNFGDGELVSGDRENAEKQLRAGMFSQSDTDKFFEYRVEAGKIYKRIGPEPTTDEKEKSLEREGAALGYLVTNNHTVLG